MLNFEDVQRGIHKPEEQRWRRPGDQSCHSMCTALVMIYTQADIQDLAKDLSCTHAAGRSFGAWRILKQRSGCNQVKRPGQMLLNM